MILILNWTVKLPYYLVFVYTSLFKKCDVKLCVLILKYLNRLSVSHSVVSNSLWPHGLQSTRLLCPWNSLGKNTGVGSCSLLHEFFPTQGSNLDLLHCRQILYHLEPPGKPQWSPWSTFNGKSLSTGSVPKGFHKIRRKPEPHVAGIHH